MNLSQPTRKQHGSCHCGKVRFEFEMDLGAPASRCNCSICTKVGGTGQLVKPDAFTLLSDESDLGTYQWGSKIGTRFFCRHCGVHCFASGHLDVLGGDFVSVNLNCLDEFELTALDIVYFDGRHNNWQTRSTPWPILPAA